MIVSFISASQFVQNLMHDGFQ
jgi:hypothetical protein